MPIYEFLCPSCNQKKSVFVRSIGAEVSPVCDSCGSGDLRRLVSRVAYHRSLRDVWEHSGSPNNPGPDYYSDPRNIGRWAEQKFSDFGEEMPGEIKQMIDAAREGELPGTVKDLQPNLGEL